MFVALLAEATELTAGGTYPGGASLEDPVPEQVQAYGNEWLYGAYALVFLLLLLFLITRLNVER